MKLSPTKKARFQEAVWGYYRSHKRGYLPWRKNITPYRVWVSEIMLQQTQVDRVVPFFKNWMKQFGTVKKLALGNQIDVLKAWKGLGYNSRALRMKKTAQIISEKYKDKFPKTYEELVELPGIGPYTAAAICTFAYDESRVFIETNIRRVFLHHFFKERNNIHDRELLNLIEQTLPKKNFRDWYYALMDYGSYLGKMFPNANTKSRHYSKQKKFEGSDRQIRGKILELLLAEKGGKISHQKIFGILKTLSEDSERVEMILQQLEEDGFLEIHKASIFLSK